MSIESLRREMDELDKELIRLLSARFDLARAIGRVKKEAGLAVLDAGREEAILERICALAPNHAEAIGGVYREMFAASRRIQEEDAL